MKNVGVLYCIRDIPEDKGVHKVFWPMLLPKGPKQPKVFLCTAVTTLRRSS